MLSIKFLVGGKVTDFWLKYFPVFISLKVWWFRDRRIEQDDEVCLNNNMHKLLKVTAPKKGCRKRFKKASV